MPTVADVLGATAAKLGCSLAFGLLGDGNLELALSFQQAGIGWLPLRREDSVVAAADGYSQATGRVGVGLVTQGPGLANALNALVGAAKGSTPLVLLCGELTGDWSEPQCLDQAELVRGTGASYRSVVNTVRASEMLVAAFAEAARERRPIVLGVPTAQQTATPRNAVKPPRIGYEPQRESHMRPTEEAVAAAGVVLSRSERPVLIAGRGALAAREPLVRLAEAAGCLLSTSLLARGLFEGDPYDLGICGGFSSSLGDRLIREADVVVACGASLNDYTTKSGALTRGKPIIKIDHEKHAIGGLGPADVAVLGDVGVTAAVLRARVDRRDAGYRTAEVRRAISEYDASSEFVSQSDESGLDLRDVAYFLNVALPPDRAVTFDLGYFTSEPAKYVKVLRPNRQAFTLHFGSIGLALATSIGLAAADPSVPTLCCVGDGGLASAVGELESVRRSGLPIVIAVFNDSAYGMEYHALLARRRSPRLSQNPLVNVAAVATAYGLRAMTLRRREDFARAMPLLRHITEPLLLDFRTRSDVLTSWYAEVTGLPTPERVTAGRGSDERF